MRTDVGIIKAAEDDVLLRRDLKGNHTNDEIKIDTKNANAEIVITIMR
jgi:hypothetical protein